MFNQIPSESQTHLAVLNQSLQKQEIDSIVQGILGVSTPDLSQTEVTQMNEIVTDYLMTVS